MGKLFQINYLLTFISLFLLIGVGYSQDKKAMKMAKEADQLMFNNNFGDAKEIYQELVSKYPENRDFNFYLGLTYFKSQVEVEKGLEYLDKGLELSKVDTIGENLLYYAKTLHFMDRFEEAMVYYNHFKDFVFHTTKSTKLKDEVYRSIEMCNNGIRLTYESPGESAQVDNLGEKVNTEYPEYAPILNNDEDLMFMTSRRPESSKGKLYDDNLTFEDIYYTQKNEDGSWSEAENIDKVKDIYAKKINTKTHDATITISPDGNTLYIYHKNDIWKSTRNDKGKWSEPVRMNNNINLGEVNPSVFISYDQQELYIVSIAEGSFGGKDIFVAHKTEDGEWSEPENLGLNINTEFDEDAPFLTSDGKTLFFSSKGHNSIGGYDIFKSERQADGSWGEVENLGFPINSGGDDIFYIQNTKGEKAYFSSLRPGSYGYMDIYGALLECKSIPNTEIRGYAMLGKQQLPASGSVEIFDQENGSSLGIYQINPHTGEYKLILPPEKTYNLKLNLDNYQTERLHEEEFTLPKQCEEFQLFQSVNVQMLVDSLNQPYASEAHFRNAFFNIKDSIQINTTVSAVPENEITTDKNDGKPLNGLFGELNHNQFLNAENVKIMLVRENEIVRTNTTNQRGEFAFEKISPDELSLLIDVEDAKLSYFGDGIDNVKNDVLIKGSIQGYMIKDSVYSLKGINVYFIDQNKKIINATLTDENGNFELSAIPSDPESIQMVNENLSFVYSLNVDNTSILYSAYVKTLNPDDMGEFYTEYIDIINIEQQAPMLGQDFADILFDFDKYVLRDTSKKILDRLYDFMSSNPNIKLKLDGHTDWIGTDDYNMNLSDNRSNSAYKYLSSKGISTARMTTFAYGESQPKVPNANPDGSDNPNNRQLNRRVEIQVDIPGLASLTLFM